MSGCIAVINAGSSSVKFAIYESVDMGALYRGQVEGIGTAPCLRIVDTKSEVIADRTWPNAGFDHDMATKEILRAGQSSCRAG